MLSNASLSLSSQFLALRLQLERQKSQSDPLTARLSGQALSSPASGRAPTNPRASCCIPTHKAKVTFKYLEYTETVVWLILQKEAVMFVNMKRLRVA